MPAIAKVLGLPMKVIVNAGQMHGKSTQVFSVLSR